MKRMFFIILFLLAGLSYAQSTFVDTSATGAEQKKRVGNLENSTYGRFPVKAVLIDSAGNVISSLPVTIDGAAAAGGAIPVYNVNASVGYDSTIGAWKFYALNLDKYEAIAHTVDTSASVGANHYEIISMEGYRNLDISVITTDATGVSIKVFRTYDSNISESSTTGWYNCTNEFFGSGATLTLVGSDQAQDGTSAEMMPLKYLIWYAAATPGTNSVDIFTRKHTKR